MGSRVSVAYSFTTPPFSYQLTNQKMSIDLYHMDLSAPCRAVRLTAKMVGVELNLKELNLMAGEQMTPEFIKINPQHNIPTIVDDGFSLNESRAICGYLVQKYAKDDTLYPKEAKARAIVDQRLYFDMGVFYQKFGSVYYPVMFKGATKLDEQAVKEFAVAVEYLNTFLSESKYAAGDHLTIADIVLVASASTFEAADPNVFEKYPKIKTWLETCKNELVDYAEANQTGVDGFGQFVQGALAKLE